MSSSPSGKREFIVATGLALMLGVLLSFIAVYGLNRYFGSVDEIQTTGSLRHPWSNWRRAKSDFAEHGISRAAVSDACVSAGAGAWMPMRRLTAIAAAIPEVVAGSPANSWYLPRRRGQGQVRWKPPSRSL
jgi:hypothetical protein